MNNLIEFKLAGSQYIELKNLLKVSGFCQTGGAAKAAVEQGEVLVDGVLEKRKGLKLKPGQIVTFMKKQIKVIA